MSEVALHIAPLWRRIVTSRGVQLIAATVLLGGLLVMWIDAMGGVEGVRDRFGWYTAVILVPVQALVAVSPIPSEVVALPSSAIHGFTLGAILNWIAWMLAAMLQYALARRTAQDFDFDGALDRLPGWLRRYPVDHPAFLIGVRQLPWGAHVTNSAAGAFRVSLWRHIWCAAIGIVPGALLISALGNELLRF